MGELGFSRQEFLHELRWWEVHSIIRGYRQRNRLEQQLLRLTAYSSFFAFRENKQRLTPQQWLPFTFDKEDEDDEENGGLISDEEIARLQAEMRQINEEKRRELSS